MYDTYTCPLQPCTHLTVKLLTQGHPRSAEVTHIEDFKSAYISVMLLERGIRDISRVLVLARNSVYSACSVEDAIPHVYKMEGHRSFRQNPLILSS